MSACPFCSPREDENQFWQRVEALEASTLYLNKNQAYQGHCTLVFDRRHAEGLEALTAEEFAAFSRDLRKAAVAIAGASSAELMNYASFGNVVRHLHWHIVPRRREDPRWGGPIYTTSVGEMASAELSAGEFKGLLDAIRSELQNAI